MNKKVINYLLILVGVPVLIAIGMAAFKDERYNLISVLIAVLACLPFFINFERKGTDSKKLILIAVMTALVVVSRCIFIAVPSYKPMTAIIIITAIYFGAESAFLVGALAAIISNMFFGQGPWTPIQMFVWGIVGFIGGLIAKKGWLDNIAGLVIYGIIGGIIYSLIMDLWSVISMDGTFNFGRYITMSIGSLPYTARYAVANVVFLLVLKVPIGKVLERIKRKYAIED